MKAPDYHACLTGECNHKKQMECLEAISPGVEVSGMFLSAFEETGDPIYKTLAEALDRALGVK